MIAIIFYIIKSKCTHENHLLFLPILSHKCDSLQYAEVYDLLYKKEKSLDIFYLHAVSLTWCGRDNEIEQVLNDNQVYHKISQYKMAKYALYKENTSEAEYLYQDIKASFIKRMKNKKTGKQWERELNALEAMHFILQRKYNQALPFLDKVQVEAHTCYEVKNKYQKAVCLFYLGQREEAVQLFEWVIANGNNLIHVKKAQQYINENRDNS